jgi:hypothetical protein
MTTAAQRAKRRAATKRLVRRTSYKSVAHVLGCDVGTVARYVAGEPMRSDVERRIDRVFSELGADLGLVQLTPMPRRELTPMPGEAHLRLVRDDEVSS